MSKYTLQQKKTQQHQIITKKLLLIEDSFITGNSEIQPIKTQNEPCNVNHLKLCIKRQTTLQHDLRINHLINENSFLI